MKIKNGDNVIIISGKDRGKKGKVTRALSREDKVIVEGVNIKKKHQKPKKNNQKGQIVEFTAPIHISNVMMIDKKTEQPTRIGYEMRGGKKVRVSKKSNTII